MYLFELVFGFLLGVSSVIIVFILKCKCIYSDNHTIRKDQRIKRNLDLKERSYKKYVSDKNEHKMLKVNINKIKTQIKSTERNDKKPFREYKDIITRIEVLKMYIEKMLKNSADLVSKVQGPPPPPPPPPAPTVSIVQKPPPPPPMAAAGNSVSSSAGQNVTVQKTYHIIPITTELLKSVVLKPPGERKVRKHLSGR